MFVLLTQESWDKFEQQRTTITTNVVQADEGEKRALPCFSFRVASAYKNTGFFITYQNYLKNTYGLEDIFTAESVSILKNKEMFDIFSTRTILFGNVITVCPLEKMGRDDELSIKLKRYISYEIFALKDASERVFHLLDRFPVQDSRVEISTRNIENKVMGDLRISEFLVQNLNKKQKPCFESTLSIGQNFTSCTINQIGLFLLSNIKCVIPGIEEFLPVETDIKTCSNHTAAFQTLATLINNVLYTYPKEPFLFGCLVPCRQASVMFDLRYFHENSFLGFLKKVTIIKKLIQ
jgi:hypothetical protein